MKRFHFLFISAGIALALFSCSSNNEFNEQNLIGSWEIYKGEEFIIATDSLTNTYTLSPGQGSFTFNSDGTASTAIFTLSANGTYSLSTYSGSDIIIFTETGETDSDTLEILRFTGDQMDFSDKIDESSDSGDDDYSIYYLQKL